MSPSHTPKVATVEVLSAEVRVLQIERRQVTLTLYRQLDGVDPDAIEPFGRISDPQDDAKYDEYANCGPFVIGRARWDDPGRGIRAGDLVRAQAAFAEACGVDVAAWRALPLIVLAGLR